MTVVPLAWSAVRSGRSKPVMQFGGEDRKPQPVAGEPVQAAAPSVVISPLMRSRARSVAGLIYGVVDAAEQPGHQRRQVLVGDAGGGEHAGG
jgi:hypothetical protein